MNLWNLKPASTGTIEAYDQGMSNPFQQRLNDLGFHVGTDVTCLKVTPFNGPRVFFINDNVFSLAHDVASKIHIKHR